MLTDFSEKTSYFFQYQNTHKSKLNRKIKYVYFEFETGLIEKQLLHIVFTGKLASKILIWLSHS